MNKAKAKVPGKLILSGEHAVVYGCPAIAVAVNNFVTTTITSIEDSKIQGIPNDLIRFVVNNFLKVFDIKNHHGFNINIDSNIPIGCGMGSSAAVALSVIGALAAYFQKSLTFDEYFNLTQAAEKIQHGNPSGIDAYICLHGGCICFQKGNIKKLNIKHELPIYIVNSGTPCVSTKDCVTKVAAKFKGSNIWEKFSAVTTNIITALAQNNLSQLQNLMRENHQLLVEVGVVPQKAQQFIAEIEKAKGAAKISGAGAVQGDNAGIILVLSTEPDSIKKICKRFDYNLQRVQFETGGLQVV